MDADPGGFEHQAVGIGQGGVDHEVGDRVEPAEEGEREPAELGVVGHDHHLLPARHHRPLGLDQEQVRVVDPFADDPPRPEDRLADPDPLHHCDRQRAKRHAGPGIDVAADQDEVGLLAGSRKLGDGQAVGHDLHRPAEQGPSDFKRRRPTVEQHRVAVVDQGCRRLADGPFFQGRAGGPLVESRERPPFGRSEYGPAVGPLDGSGQVERFQVAADRALGDAERLDQFVEGREPLAGDPIQEHSTSRLGEH